MKNQMLSIFLVVVILTSLTGFTCSSNAIIKHESAIIPADESIMINTGFTEPVILTPDSHDCLIYWFVNHTPSVNIDYELLLNGTNLLLGVLWSGDYYVYYTVPIDNLQYGAYNYTLVISDTSEMKSSSIIVLFLEEAPSDSLSFWTGLIAAAFGGTVIMVLSRAQRLKVKDPSKDANRYKNL
ncbi:MAG: hypothetical protein ACFFDM_00960 [Candidatus Thorarchaeota archaeon]